MPDIRCPLEEAAERRGDRPAVTTPSETISYTELHRRVDRAAFVLRARGCQPGDRIGLFMPNSVEYLVWLLGVMRMGAVCCPLNTRLPVRAIADLLGRIDCHTLIAHDMSSVQEGVRDRVLIPHDALEQTVSRESGAACPMVSLGTPVTIVFTSGSAGPPKAVLHSYGNHYYSARGATQNLPLGVGDRWLLDLPLYHVGGLGIVFRCILAGATVVIPAKEAPLEVMLERYGITHLSVVVTQLYRLLQGPAESVRYPLLRCVVLGGSPVPMKLLTRAHARGLPVFASYGCTEMASQVTTTGIESTEEQRLTSGRLLPYRELTIAEDGEILLRGETLFMGYVEGREVRRSLTRAGWFCTGDLGRVDDGYLTVQGRKDNRFFSGGETIYPEEIERALAEFDDIDQAVVVPIPHEEFGQRCVAFVRARNGCPPYGVLANWLGRTLPRYKIPDAFYEWPAADDSAQLKIDRARFRGLALERVDGRSGEGQKGRWGDKGLG